MKCIVKDCENHVHQGNFVGAICSPCNQFLTTGEGIYSQLYRNTVVAEREACAKRLEEYRMNDGKSGQHSDWYFVIDECIAVLRARGRE